jgi:O-antigen ligase
MRLLVGLQLASVTLLITLNVRDSTVLKLPVAWAFATLLVAVSAAFAFRSGRAEVAATPADLPILLTVFGALAGLLFVPHRPSAVPAVLLVLVCATTALAGAHLVRTREQMGSLTTLLTWLAGFMVAAGVFQLFVDERMGFNFFTGSDRRVVATLGNPAFLGGWIVLVLPVLVADLLGRPLRSTGGALQGAVIVGLFILLLLTRTRSSLLALPCGFFVFLLWRGGGFRRPLMIGGAAAAMLTAGAVLFIPGMGERLGSLTDVSGGTTFARRVPIWEAGWHAFLSRPILGHGPGQFERVMRDHRSPDYWTTGSEDLTPHAHNEPIELLADGGIVALLLFGWVVAAALRSAWGARGDSPSWPRTMSAGIVGGMGALLVDNLANVSMRQPPVAILFWLLLGLLLSPSLGAPQGGRSLMALRLPAVPWTLPLLLWGAGMVWYGGGVADRVSAERSTLRGVLAGVRKEEAKAPEYFAAAAKADPDYLEGVFGAASSFLMAGRPGEALAYSAILRARAPNYPRLAMVEAAAYYQVDSLPAALRSIRDELSRSTHPENWYIAAKIHENTGETAAEHAALEELLRACVRGRTTLYMRHAGARLCLICPAPSAAGHGISSLRELAMLMPGAADAAGALRTLEECAAARSPVTSPR